MLFLNWVLFLVGKVQLIWVSYLYASCTLSVVQILQRASSHVLSLVDIFDEIFVMLGASLQLGYGLLVAHAKRLLLQRKLWRIVHRPVEVSWPVRGLVLVLVGLITVRVILSHESDDLWHLMLLHLIFCLGTLSHNVVWFSSTSHFLQHLRLVELSLQVLRVLQRGRRNWVGSLAATVGLGNLVELSNIGDAVVRAQLRASDVCPPGGRGHAEIREPTHSRRLLINIHRWVFIELLWLIGLGPNVAHGRVGRVLPPVNLDELLLERCWSQGWLVLPLIIVVSPLIARNAELSLQVLHWVLWLLSVLSHICLLDVVHLILQLLFSGEVDLVLLYDSVGVVVQLLVLNHNLGAPVVLQSWLYFIVKGELLLDALRLVFCWVIFITTLQFFIISALHRVI